MAVDLRGRLIVSDQGEAGLFRVTPPAIGGDASQTRVERIPLPISMAQGMTCALGSLHVVVNGKIWELLSIGYRNTYDMVLFISTRFCRARFARIEIGWQA